MQYNYYEYHKVYVKNDKPNDIRLPIMDTPMSKELIESMKQVNNDSVAGTESIGKSNDFASVAVFLLSELSKLIQCHTIKMNITKQNLKNNEE